MKSFKVSIYPQTVWSVEVEAENEEEAKKKALDLEGPSEPGYKSENEWYPEIWEWPNIGPKGEVNVEEI